MLVANTLTSPTSHATMLNRGSQSDRRRTSSGQWPKVAISSDPTSSAVAMITAGAFCA